MRKLGILFLLLSFSAFAETNCGILRFQSITKENGLPHNFVHAITQDQKGFIWIGTNYGLARYDGYTFKIFQPDPKKPYSITHKPIGNVFADSENNLWLAINSDGVNRMDLATERFKGYFTDKTGAHKFGSYPKVFYEDIEKRLWVASNYGIFLYDKQKDEFTYTNSNQIIRGNGYKPSKLIDDMEGNIWFKLNKKIRILNKNTLVTYSFGELASNPIFNADSFNNIELAEPGKVWISTNTLGLIKYDVVNKKASYYLKSMANIKHVFQDRNGNLFVIVNNPNNKLLVFKKENIDSEIFSSYDLFQNTGDVDYLVLDDPLGNVWISGGEGLAKYDAVNGVSFYKNNKLQSNSIASNLIDNIFIDQTNNLWLCPNRAGINKADLNQKPFYLYEPQVDNIQEISRDKNVSSIFEDSKGNIWAGIANYGVSIYSKQHNKWFRYYLDSYEAITSIYEDPLDGTIWLGNVWPTLFHVKPPQFDPRSAKQEFQFKILGNYEAHGVREIVTDKQNNIWIGTLEGICKLNRASNEFINYSQQYDSLNVFSSFVRALYIDNEQIVWSGSNAGGLCRFDPLSKQFKHYLPDANNSKSIESNAVYDIYEDGEGSLWIGTAQGLEKFNKQTEEFEHAGKSSALYMRSIFGVIPDEMGNLWLSSDIGIIKYTISTDETVFFGKADGLQNNEFTTTAKFKDKLGNIYFGGSEGIISFNPTLMKPNTIHPKPVITNFLVHNKVISPGDSLNGRVLIDKQVWNIDKIELNYNEADFIIEFSALHYSAPSKNQFQYMLEGFNNDWVFTTADKRYASYTGLPPGDYTFILKASNNDGLMCDERDVVKLNISIIPAFWQTLWFKLIVSILLIGTASFLVIHRMLTMRRINKSLDLKIKERTAELENVNQFLEERTIELEEVNTILEDRQEEINIQKEEILTQLNSLIEQQSKILDQNIELDKHRNHLETLVEGRTKELAEALVKAEQSDKLKTSFLTNMSHEIRTPMNAILGFSKLLQGDMPPEKREKFNNMIDANGKLLLTLINDILDLSSIQAQHVSLKPTNNNLYNVLLKIYDTFKVETKNKKLAFNLNTNGLDKNLIFYFDEVRLKQVLINLISNAIKFTEKGTIEFGVTTIDTQVTFYVTDTGIGIDKDFGESIFERFFKIETDKTQLYRGTGLGLAICKSIVNLWKGEIWYNSEKGKGTTFNFTLPITKISETKTETKPELIIHLDLSGLNVLIAEDEESNYILLEDYLAETNANITWVKNGADAVEMIKKRGFHLVLMDIKMPLMNGMEATKAIKALYPELPIIAQTAYAFSAEIEEILKSGMDTYLTKPIDKHDLFRKISYYISI